MIYKPPELPELQRIIENYLDNRGLAVTTKQDLIDLRSFRMNPPKDAHTCPYPLFSWKFGLTHEEYLGSILEDENGVVVGVVRCAACGNISLEMPVPMA